MSYHPLNNNYLNINPIILPDPFSIINKSNINTNVIKSGLKQFPTDKFNFQSSKAFITQQKQWINSFKINDIQLANSSTGKTVEKPKTSSLADQRKNYLQNNGLIQENLIKTVKHTNFSYKKPFPQVNPESFKQFSFPFSQITQTHPYNTPIQTDRIRESKNHILSIGQIRQIEKKQLDQKIVHKITSSSSRQKLKTSSSKDSKASSHIQRKSINLNGNVQRYNKYINDGLININIDLRKEIAGNIVAPNLNVRKFGQSSSHLHQSVPNHQRFGSDLTQISKQTNQKDQKVQQISKNIIKDEIKQSRIKPQICRQSVPFEDQNLPIKFKNRSKSNLSKYSQLRQSVHKETFNLNLCMNEQSIQKSTKKLQPQTLQTPQKLHQSVKQESNQKIQRKIHSLSYSSAKNKGQNNLQKQQFYQKLQMSYHTNQKEKQDRVKDIENTLRQSRGISINQSRRFEGSQTQRKMIISNDQKQSFEQKIQRKPIRLTLQKKI